MNYSTFLARMRIDTENGCKDMKNILHMQILLFTFSNLLLFSYVNYTSAMLEFNQQHYDLNNRRL